MTKQSNSIFPIRFNYNGKGFETKALKCAGKREVLYKIALPSAVSTIQQCWISNNSDQWRLVIGSAAEKSLMQELIKGINQYENIVAIYTEPDNKQALKSA